MPEYSNPPRNGADPIVSGLNQAFLALFSIGVRERQTYSDILLQTLLANPTVLSTWTVWEPNALDGRDATFRGAPGHDATGRFVHCWHRAHGKHELVPVVDYEHPVAGNWYWIPKRRLTPCHLDPIDYRFGSHSVWISSEISPLIHAGRFCGAVGIDLKAAARLGHEKKTGRQDYKAVARCHTKRDSLSPREREVFHWLETGKTNEEIGVILGISHHTVKNHIERIFQKLGVNNRYEAILSIK